MSLYKKIYTNEIFIYDIGAGQRILPEVLNFNGISKVILVDPNKNIEYSFRVEPLPKMTTTNE